MRELAADLGLPDDFGHEHLVDHLRQGVEVGQVAHDHGRFTLTSAGRLALVADEAPRSAPLEPSLLPRAYVPRRVPRTSGGETTDLPTGKALDRVVAESRADVVIRGPVHTLPPSRSPSSAVGPGGQPRFATIVLSDTETLDDVETAFACGADAFLVESRAPEQLAAAVSAVAEGRRFLDPEVGARLAADAAWGHARAQGGVTQRERQVLALIAAGKTTGEIAKELGISPRTVEGHRMRVGRKLGLRRRAELIEYALVHGLRPRRPASANSTSR